MFLIFIVGMNTYNVFNIYLWNKDLRFQLALFLILESLFFHDKYQTKTMFKCLRFKRHENSSSTILFQMFLSQLYVPTLQLFGFEHQNRWPTHCMQQMHNQWFQCIRFINKRYWKNTSYHTIYEIRPKMVERFFYTIIELWVCLATRVNVFSCNKNIAICK